MKKNTLILALMLVLSLSISIIAGDTHSSGFHDTEGVEGIICQLCDFLNGVDHPSA